MPSIQKLNPSGEQGISASTTAQEIAQELTSATKLEELNSFKARFGAKATKEAWRYLGQTNKPEIERLTALARPQSTFGGSSQEEAAVLKTNTSANSVENGKLNTPLETNHETTQLQPLKTASQEQKNLHLSTPIDHSNTVEPISTSQSIISSQKSVQAPRKSSNQSVDSNGVNTQVVNAGNNETGTNNMSSNNLAQPNENPENTNGQSLSPSDVSRFEGLVRKIPQLLATSGQEPILRIKVGSKIAFEGVPGQKPVNDFASDVIGTALKAIEDPKGFTGKLEITYKGEMVYSQQNDVVQDPHGIGKYLQQTTKQTMRQQPQQSAQQPNADPDKQQAQTSNTPITEKPSELEQIKQQLAKLQLSFGQANQRISGLESTLATQQQELEKLRQFQAKMSSSPISNLGDKLGNWVEGVRTKAADVLRGMAQRVEGKIETTKSEITSVQPQQLTSDATQSVPSLNNQTTLEGSPSIPAQAWERYSNQTQDKNYLGQARVVAISALRDGIGENGVREILSASPALQKDGKKILHGHVESTLKYAKFYVNNEKSQQQQPTQTQQQQEGLSV